MKSKYGMIILISLLIISANVWGEKAKAATPSNQEESLGIDFGTGIDLKPASGYLAGTSGYDTINLNTEEDPIHVVFSWDSSLYPSVRVYGESYNLLDVFELGDIDTITLSGGGKFTLEIFARSGSGNWSCEALNEFDYQLTYGDFMKDIIAAPLSGYIGSTSEVDKIKVDSIVDPAFAVFEWDEGMELWVKVLGEDENLLGEFDLAKGNEIELKGAGLFTLLLTSKSGYGNWSCEVLSGEEQNILDDEPDFVGIEINNSVSETTEKSFVSSFLTDMVAYDTEKLKSYISPEYLDQNGLNIEDYKVNTYSPVDFSIEGYDAYTGIVDCLIWGTDKGWTHVLEFKVVVEDGKYYLYPSEHGDEYIHPWNSVKTWIEE